jgi:hypothetical protein
VPDSLWEREKLAAVIEESRDDLKRTYKRVGEPPNEPLREPLRASSARWRDYYRTERF